MARTPTTLMATIWGALWGTVLVYKLLPLPFTQMTQRAGRAAAARVFIVFGVGAAGGAATTLTSPATPPRI